MYYKSKPVYEMIRKIPVSRLLRMEQQQLSKFEKDIKCEVWRAQIALRWIQGVKKLKIKQDGEYNGK